MANDLQSLAHTKWNCKYHIVFAPKYRRMVFYGEKKREIGKILRQLCDWKGVEIHEAEVCPDHIHMLVFVYCLLKARTGQKGSLCRVWNNSSVIE